MADHWLYDRVELIDGDEPDEGELFLALRNGWEPFAVTREERWDPGFEAMYPTTFIHLRRRPETDHDR